MPVVATAGHVDHGKSTLVKALTGRDPDRWEEEKRRGLTIDLGFAWMTLPGGETLSFVDVPGHRRFIANMLAGVGPVDFALLVVAADEGWMPQTEEHLAVLDLLGVHQGLVAVTKTDRVDQETVTARMAEIDARLKGTTLAGAEMLPVSATTGHGLDRLREELHAMVGQAEGGDGSARRPRLWVDRVFSVAGTGTVVTGTLTGGALAVGDQVSVWPNVAEARVRGLHQSDQPVDRASPVSRVAVNLSGVDRSLVTRGSMLCRPGSFMPTQRLLVELRSAREQPEIGRRGSYMLHLGTYSGTVKFEPLESGFALAFLTDPVWSQSGDRFVVRDVGRERLIGGGRVLAPDPPRRRVDVRRLGGALLEVIDLGPDQVADVLLEQRVMAPISWLDAQSGGGSPTDGEVAGGYALSPEGSASGARRSVAAVDRYQRVNQHEPGMPLVALATELGLNVDLARAVVTKTELIQQGALVAALNPKAVDEDPKWQKAREALEASGLAPPSLAELGLGGELLRNLIRESRLVRVSDDFAYLPSQVAELLALIHGIGGSFSVSDFRQAAGISRKHAVPILEWADREGHTIREGDLRRTR